MQYTDIRFPHLGVMLSDVGRAISIGDFQIMYYGIIIASGFLAGLLIAQKEAKRTGQNPELYSGLPVVDDDTGNYRRPDVLCDFFLGLL